MDIIFVGKFAYIKFQQDHLVRVGTAEEISSLDATRIDELVMDAISWGRYRSTENMMKFTFH